MKKILLAIVAAITAIPALAQYNSGGFTIDSSNLYYGIRVGMTAATLNGSTPNFNPKGARVGLTLGGVVGLHISDSSPIFLESGLYYTEKGSRGYDTADLTHNDKVKASLNYLELPLLIKYGVKLNDDIAILPYFGPYFSLAISGKTNQHSSFNDGYLKHFDTGFKVGSGIEYKKLYFELGYEFGIVNVSDAGKPSAHTGAFIANLGVNF